MKRRNLLKGGAALAGAAPALAASRLYGAPASISPQVHDASERLTLSLGRAGFADEFASTAKRMSTIWNNIIYVDGEAGAFNQDPSEYLERYGFDGSDQVLTYDTLVTLRSLAAPSVRSALLTKDYPNALTSLREMGALAPRDNPGLKARLRDAIQRQRASLVEYLAEKKQNIDPTSLSLLKQVSLSRWLPLRRLLL